MPAQDGGGSVDRLLDELVALERSALDGWIRSYMQPELKQPVLNVQLRVELLSIERRSEG
jgi:hypothetical protein